MWGTHKSRDASLASSLIPLRATGGGLIIPVHFTYSGAAQGIMMCGTLCGSSRMREESIKKRQTTDLTTVGVIVVEQIALPAADKPAARQGS